MAWIYLIAAVVLAAVLLDRLVPAFSEMIKGWKTTLFGVLTGSIGLLETFDWASIVRDDLMPYWMLGIGVLIVYLRFRTTTAVGEKS